MRIERINKNQEYQVNDDVDLSLINPLIAKDTFAKLTGKEAVNIIKNIKIKESN